MSTRLKANCQKKILCCVKFNPLTKENTLNVLKVYSNLILCLFLKVTLITEISDVAIMSSI